MNSNDQSPPPAPLAPLTPLDLAIIPAAARPVLSSFLDDRDRERTHLVVALSGAHAYGFPSPDSDFDLKAIHIAPTAALLGLRPQTPTGERMETIEGVELDYTSNELQMALQGILKGNGNYLERVLGAIQLRTSSELDSLRPLVERSLSRRAFHHYHGFAQSQLGEFERGASAKRALYVLRTTLTGTHLLRTGRLVVDVNQLLDEHGFGAARELISAKLRGERTALDETTAASWRTSLGRAFELLDEARAHSVLPEAPDNEAELEAWLIEVRRARW